MRARWQNDDFRRDVDAIRGDVAQLKADLSAAMRDLISASREGLGEARERLQARVEQKLGALNRATEEMDHYGRQTGQRVRRELGDRPARSALIVLGLGAIVGMLLMSGRRR